MPWPKGIRTRKAIKSHAIEKQTKLQSETKGNKKIKIEIEIKTKEKPQIILRALHFIWYLPHLHIHVEVAPESR